MTTPEARRHDLYNGLIESLGEERADTLMAHLPATDSTQAASKADIAVLGDRVNHVADSVQELSRRVDRILFALIAGLVAIVATLISQLPG